MFTTGKIPRKTLQISSPNYSKWFTRYDPRTVYPFCKPSSHVRDAWRPYCILRMQINTRQFQSGNGRSSLIDSTKRRRLHWCSKLTAASTSSKHQQQAPAASTGSIAYRYATYHKKTTLARDLRQDIKTMSIARRHSYNIRSR